MKIFKSKSLSVKLILVVLLVIFLINTVIPSVSYAGIGAAIGGKLIDSFCDLLVALGDGIMSIIQRSVFGITGEIAVDLTGKTPWYAYVARSIFGSWYNYSWSCNNRRNIFIGVWINRDIWNNLNFCSISRYFYDKCYYFRISYCSWSYYR